MSKLTDWLLQACNILGLHVDIGFSITLSDGYKLQAVARIHDIGAVNGMLVVLNYNGHLDELIQLGYGYAVLEEPMENEVFDLESYREMFKDWGWKK